MFGRVKDAKLFKDENGYYFLNIRYETKDSEKVMEYHFPKVRLPIELADLNVDNLYCDNEVSDRVFRLNLPYADLPCYKGTAVFTKDTEDGMFEAVTAENVWMASCVVKEKTKEMTIAEIEKKLGHKIKIVESHRTSLKSTKSNRSS